MSGNRIKTKLINLCYRCLPGIPGECVSNRKELNEKFRKSLSRSSCKRSSRSSPPPDVDPGLCCKDKLLGTGECVPSDMSESSESDGIGEPVSCRRDGKDVAPELDNGGCCILEKGRESMCYHSVIKNFRIVNKTNN